MRGDFADEARRFEDLDKAVLREIKEQGPSVAPDANTLWLKYQSLETLSDLLEALTEELARRRALKAGGY